MSESVLATIRAQVLRGLALNRTPGLHFLGNFLDLSFEEVSAARTHLRLPAGPHCVDVDGQINVGALSLLADIAMAASVRALLPPHTRLGTVSMQFQFTGTPGIGPLDAHATFDGFLTDGIGQLGLTRGEVRGAAGVVCRSHGTFMVLDPPENRVLVPLPHRRHGDAATPALSESELNETEHAILSHADGVLDALSEDTALAFASRFLGYTPEPGTSGATGQMQNGPHVGNRVDHVQGGISFGFALATARAALGNQWIVSNITASYVSPGQGRTLRARSELVHRGRLTAVARTQVLREDQRIVLDVLSNHLRMAAEGKSD